MKNEAFPIPSARSLLTGMLALGLCASAAWAQGEGSSLRERIAQRRAAAAPA
jgi:hypothetical protein